MASRRIVIFQGTSRYGVYDLWIRELSEGFNALGYEAFIVNLNDKERVQQQLYDAFTQPAAAFIGFNGMGVEFQERFGCYDERDTPFLGIYVDHPISHYARLSVRGKTLVSSFVSSEQLSYAEALWPEGSYRLLFHGASLADRPSSARPYPLTFFGSYTPSEQIAEGWASEQLLPLTLDEMIDETEGGSNYLALLEEPLAPPEIIATATAYLDSYLRQQQREQLLTLLHKEALSVDLFGEGWEQLPPSCHRNRGPVSYPQVLEVMSQSLCVLNVSPQFESGSHERLLSAMANGACAITDARQFFDHYFIDGELLTCYRFDALEELPAKIRELLNDEERRSHLATRGKERVLAYHLWRHRAKEILSLLNLPH